MGKKNLTIRFSVIFLLTIFMTAMVLKETQVDAAPKFSLNTSQITVTTGMAQVLKVKNVKAKYKIKWYSSNKSIAIVNSKGVVKGLKDGKTTIKCVVSASGKKSVLKCPVIVKTPKFAKTSYTITKGGNVQLSLKNIYSKSSYKWYTENASIAKVNSKGKVVGVGVGKTKVSVKIYIPKTSTRSAKVIVRKVNIIVKNSVTNKSVIVSNQKELTKALLDKNVCQITIKTDDKVVLTIPQGNYSKVKMNVDAPNADIINNGVFKEILIKKIATDTWTEKAKGNVLILDAAAGHIVIPKTSNIKQIQIVNANSNFKLDVQGDIDKITINSPSKVEINITGTVGSVDVNSRATVSVDGTSKEPIEVKVSEKADGTMLNSNVKVDVTSGSDTEINLSKGAEDSTVKTTNEDKSVEVTNNTDSSVSIDNGAGGKNQTVEAGKNATVDGKGNVTNSTTDNKEETNTSGGGSGGGSSSGGGGASGGGSSTGGGASSSGDLTRYVEDFESFKAIEAGTYHGDLKTVDELVELFPKTVIGYSDSDNVKFEIKSWQNTDNYSTDTCKPGYYKFTAVLGKGDIPNTVREGAEVIIKVRVKPANGDIIYSEYTNEEIKKFSIVECIEYSPMMILKLKYEGESYVSARIEVTFYDDFGKEIEDGHKYSYFEKNDINSVDFICPTKHWGYEMAYSSYTIKISAYEEEELTSIKKDLIKIETPFKVEIIDEDDYVQRITKIKVLNKGKKQVQNGEIRAYTWRNGNIIKVENFSIDGLLGGDSKELELWIHCKKDEVPDNVTLDINFVNVTKENTIQKYDNKKIVYTEDSEDDDSSFELKSEEIIKDKLVLKIGYTGSKYLDANIKVEFYDGEGNLITSSSNESYFGNGDENSLLFYLPKYSKGEIFPYNEYTIFISAYETTHYVSARNYITIGERASCELEDDNEGNYGNYTSKIPVSNTDLRKTTDGKICVYFWKKGVKIDVREYDISGILGKENTYLEVGWYGNKNEAPDKVTTEYNYVNILKEDTSQKHDYRDIVYTNTGAGATEVNHFELKSEIIVSNKLVLNLKYIGEPYARAKVTVNYYGDEKQLLEQSNHYTYFIKDSENSLVFDLPRNFNGKVIEYKEFTINIYASKAINVKSAKDKLSFDALKNFEQSSGDDGSYECTIPIKIYDNADISGLDVVVFYMKGTEIIGVEKLEEYEILGRDNLYLYWYDSSNVPDGFNIKVNYANVLNTEQN